MEKNPLHIQYIALKDGSIKRDLKDYPFNIPLIGKFKEFTFSKPVTFFIGENGTGKSTLLEAIAVSCGFNAEGGSKNFNFNTKETHSDFYKYLRIGKSYNAIHDGYFLRAESLYNLASNIDELASDGYSSLYDSYGGKSLHEQSHGESFLALLKNRLGGNGLYLFDEPEAALSPMKLLELLVIIDDLVQNNSQFIICTHSPILMAYPNAEIYEIHDGELVLTAFEDTNHYSLTKYFLSNYKQMIKKLGIEEKELP
ncbi:ABC transporter ATP-binding protein [Spirochaetia bacterium]|nr:ABC transporter ATP-binding protein [Spirochaetia bacterium]